MTVETRPIAPVEPQVKTVADVLRHAALIIEERGWCQRSLNTDDGRLCLVGSLVAAVGGDLYNKEWGPAWTAMNGYLGLLPASWNDRRGRTSAEVIAALRAAADASEAA